MTRKEMANEMNKYNYLENCTKAIQKGTESKERMERIYGYFLNWKKINNID